MIFLEKFKEREKEVEIALTELFDAANLNKVHSGEFALIHANCKQVFKRNRKGEIIESKIWLGAQNDGLCEETLRESLVNFSKNSSLISFEDNQKILSYLRQNIKAEFEVRMTFEKNLIHRELEFYLKIWESERIIGILYQLSRLAQGKRFDWHYRLCNSSRERDCTDAVNSLVRLRIRDDLKSICPKFYDLIKRSYKSDIRNAVAHTQYYLMDQNIHFVYSKHMKEVYWNREEWINAFYDTLALHHQVYRVLSNIYSYCDVLKDENNKLIIEMPDNDNPTLFKKSPISMRQYYKDWFWE